MNPVILTAFYDELTKIAFLQKSISGMDRKELRQERNKLTKQFYGTNTKAPVIGGVSGAAVSAALSKAIVGRGMIPAAVVGGLVSASAASNMRKKRILGRIRKISNRLREIEAPISHAKSKKSF